MAALRRADSDRSDSSVESRNSEGAFSISTHSTAPSDFHERPSLSRGETCPTFDQREKAAFTDDEPPFAEHIETIPFEDEVLDDTSMIDPPEDVPELFGTDAVPVSEYGFKALFPSIQQPYDIRHDSSTSDGNMNVRIDTVATTASGREEKLILFHLRMYDLKTRDFSLRRYCRDSQCEVCTNSRKTKRQQQAMKPSFARSLSNLVPKSISPKSDPKTKSRSSLERQQSGGIDQASDAQEMEVGSATRKESPKIADLSDTISVQYQNYTQIDVSRSRFGSHNYDFQYWGENYSWKRVTRNDFDLRITTYHLVRRSNGKPLAHITPKQDG